MTTEVSESIISSLNNFRFERIEHMKTLSTNDKLDEDFIFFSSFTFECMKMCEKSNKNYNHCKLWLDKLCSQNYNSVSDKRKRNLYLSRLILCIQENQFHPIFFNPPPEGNLLPSCEDVDLCNQKSLKEKCKTDTSIPLKTEKDVHKNQNLNLQNYQHLSEDGRTYLATKSLPNGILSYLAVNLGGDTPIWVNKDGFRRGFPAMYESEIEDQMSYNNAKRTAFDPYNKRKTILEKKKYILLKRQSFPKRHQLIIFYEEILRNIEQELNNLNEKNTFEYKNPFIDRMIGKLMKQIVGKDTKIKDSSKVLQNNGKSVEMKSIFEAVEQRKMLLLMLKSNIESQKKDIFETRETILTKIERAIDQEMEQNIDKNSFQLIKLKEPHILRETGYQFTMWNKIMNDNLCAKHENLLSEKYDPEIIGILKNILTREKLQILSNTESLSKQLEQQMRQDLQSEILKGINKYEEACKEWIKIQNVLKGIDKVRNQAEKKAKMNHKSPTNSKLQQNLLEISVQVSEMEAKFECLGKRNEDWINKKEYVHKKIKNLSHYNGDAQLQEQYEHILDDINKKLKIIEEQEMEIAKLKT